MKKFDLKSAVIGALLAVVITLTAAGARSSRVNWEYKVVSGYFGNPDFIGQAINASAAEGWEFVSASGPNNGNFAIAVMRRQQK